MTEGFRHHRETRALLDYLADHGTEQDFLPQQPGASYVSLAAIDRYFHDMETDRGRRATTVHALRERIRKTRPD